MSSTVTANDGAQLPLDELTQTFGYTTIGGSPYVQTITVVYASNTYVQTFTYTGTNVSAISGWIKQ
jgi:hypothetical protein